MYLFSFFTDLKIDRSGLLWEAMNMGQMATQIVAQLSEFGLSCVVHTETKCRLGDIVIQAFDTRIVPQQLQTLAVRLPQELHPWRQEDSIASLLIALAGHSRKEKTLWCRDLQKHRDSVSKFSSST